MSEEQLGNACSECGMRVYGDGLLCTACEAKAENEKERERESEQIAALKAEIAELKGMSEFARMSEADEKSVEYWREMATLADEELRLTKAELVKAREGSERCSHKMRVTEEAFALERDRRHKAEAALATAREDAAGLVGAME